ncbi:MAG: site-specific integrase [Rhodoferax sp.]
MSTDMPRRHARRLSHPSHPAIANLAVLRKRRKLRSHREVARYQASALAPSTQRAYASDLRHFRAWGGRIPATPAMVASYLVAFAGRMKASTLTRHLAAIASAHVALAKPSPTQSATVRSTLRGIRRVHGSSQVQAKPITLPVLRLITHRHKALSTARNLRDRALLLVGFAGGFRRSELVQITPSDLVFSRAGVTVTLRRSKTDPQARGRTVALPHAAGSLCPVKALKAWLAVVRQADPDMDSIPLLRRVDRYGRIGEPLSGAAVGAVLRQRLALCGIETQGFSAHSLRAGLVNAAARAGAPTWAIQRQTGHRSESTVHRYIRGLSPFEVNAFGCAAKGGTVPTPQQRASSTRLV